MWLLWSNRASKFLEVCLYVCLFSFFLKGVGWGKGTLPYFKRFLKRRFNKRELKKTTRATAAATSLNKRFNKQNNSCARAF